LFGELGERFRIAPRDDLSLDNFPTLRHVLGFLVAELGSRVAGKGLAAAPAAAVSEKTAEAATALAPQWTQSFGALRVEVLEGTPREMGLQHGRALAAEIHREIAGLVDATDARISRNGELWQGATLEELHGLADGAGINGEALESWNFVLEPLAAWRTSFATGGVDPTALSSDSTTVVQVRRPVGGLPYLLVGKAGQVLPRAGVNAAGVVVSWEPLESDPSPSDVVALTEVIHGALNTSRAHQEAHARLRNVAVRGRWCVGISRSGEPIETYFHLDQRGIAPSPPEDASPQQREFHRQMQKEPATLVLWDRQTGSSETILWRDLLRPAADHRLSQQEAASEPAFQPLRPEESRMRRHVLRMAAAAVTADGKSVYRAGDLVCAIGPAALGEPLRGAWEKFGCRTLLLTEGDWPAQLRDLLVGEVPRHLLLLHEAAAPLAELDRFRAADHFVEIVEATRQWIEALERQGGVAGSSLVALTRMGGDFGFHSLKGGFSGGGLTGLLKAIRREFAALTAKVLDFDGDCPPNEIARCLAEEMAGGSTELEVGFRRGRRYVVQAVAQPLVETLREIPRGSVWVVTGGGRGVTAAVARELGRRFGVQLHLLGTTPAPRGDAPRQGRSEAELKELRRETSLRARQDGKVPSEEWQRLERAMELDDNLRRLREEGIQSHYHCCDITDAASLDATLKEIRRAHGPIQGVIHGAGIEAACRFVRKQPSAVRRCIAVKCDGAANLAALTRRDPLRYFVGFGSTSGRFGGLGQADYSLASDLLAKMVGRLAAERPDCRCVCFHWPAWGDVGMAVRPESKSVLQRAGIAFMPVQEGIAHLIGELLAGGEEREILVFEHSGFLDVDGTTTRSATSEDLAVFRADSAAPPPRSAVRLETGATQDGNGALRRTSTSIDCSAMGLIQSLSADAEPGRYAASVLLDPAKDPFLINHRFKGMPFLPAVISMEIFAEAVGLIEPRATLLGLSEVRLINGLVLPPSRTYEARVVIERCPEGYRCRLVGPFVNGQGRVLEQERLYASALVELGEGPPPIEKRDPGEPALDWFPVAFPQDAVIVHGPSLQACKAAVCQHDGARAKIRGAAPATLLGGRAFDRLLLPCAELDACLFACGLYGYCMLERVRGVPSAITRYRQARLPQPGEECVLRVFYRESNDRGSVYDFFLVGAAKDMILEVQGYQTSLA